MQSHAVRMIRWILVCCLLTTSVASAQSTTTRQVGHNLYLMSTGFEFPETVNNLVLSGRHGLLLVDTIDAGQYDLFRSGLDQISEQPVEVLINTQWHHDHTGLNADFVVNEGTDTIIAHWHTGDFLSAAQYLEDLDTTVPALPAEAQPNAPVYFGKLLHRSGERILLLSTPPNAHSNTDLVVFFLNSNVVHMGDIYFGDSYPFIDRGSGGTIEGMIQACKLVMLMVNEHTLVVPSHGPVGDRSALKAYINMLETVRNRIQTLVDHGLSEQEAVAEEPLADLDAEWGWFFMSGAAFTTLVYRDLSDLLGS
ncbi:MBL fold metallo-hydrolase [Myxococcota bacterium]